MNLPIDMEPDEPVGVPYKAVFRFDTGDVHFEGVIPFGAYKSAQAAAPSEGEVLPPLPEPDFRDEWTDQKLDWWSADMMRAYARTAVAAAQARETGVPQGWKLVPVEPTPEMRKAAADAWLDCDSKLFLNKAGAAVRAAIAISKESA